MPTSILEKSIFAKRSDTSRVRIELDQLVAVAVFSGVGLPISLVVVLFGMQGAWLLQ